MTTIQIETENTQMTNDLYRLLKKYTGLRNLIRELKVLEITCLVKNYFLLMKYFLIFDDSAVWCYLSPAVNRVLQAVKIDTFSISSRTTSVPRCTRSFLATRCSKTWSRTSCTILTTWRFAMRWTHSAGCANKWGTQSPTDRGRFVASFAMGVQQMEWNRNDDLISAILNLSVNH